MWHIFLQLEFSRYVMLKVNFILGEITLDEEDLFIVLLARTSIINKVWDSFQIIRILSFFSL